MWMSKLLEHESLAVRADALQGALPATPRALNHEAEVTPPPIRECATGPGARGPFARDFLASATFKDVRQYHFPLNLIKFGQLYYYYYCYDAYL